MKRLLIILVFMAVTSLLHASIANVYIAQTATGSADGSSCANAYAATFFNTAANWGSGSTQIGPASVVHICGAWTGGNAVNFLQFQGSGASGSVIELLFETGAIMEPSYCAAAGCIDLNGESYILINGGPTCGETSHWNTTSCNGTIENYAVGSPGATCPNGLACAQISGSVSSAAIGTNTSNVTPTNVEVENLYVHMYTRLTGDTTDGGGGTTGIGFSGGTLADQISVHNMIFNGIMKDYLISLGTTTGTVTGYEFYNNNSTSQCWAMGVGADAPSLNITHLIFHDNEVSNWDAWAYNNTSGNICHTNGTMWFNGDGSTIHTGTGFVGDSTSMMYDNYLHGSLTGGFSTSSPSGFLSCQDNCIDVSVFNNIIHYTNVGGVGGGAPIYFNGAGGGQQLVYNNTMLEDSGIAGSCVVVTGTTGPVTIQNNIFSGCGDLIEIRPNCPTCAVSNYNDGYNVVNTWVVNNSATSGAYISLATWQSSYSQDLNSSTSTPNLSGTFGLGTGSAAIGLGTNLTSANIIALDSDISGAARPSTGAWDAGAFNYVVPYSGVTPPEALLAIIERQRE